MKAFNFVVNKKFQQLGIVVSLATLFGCSSPATPQQTEYIQYQAKTNSVEKSSGENVDVAKATLLPENMKNDKNELKVIYARQKEINIHADEDSEEAMVFKQGSGHMSFRGVIELVGDKPALADWRCKFYDVNGDDLYEAENNSIAKSTTGLGWHRIKVYPRSSKANRHEDSVFKCIAPSTAAVKAQVEVHDTANDITVYK